MTRTNHRLRTHRFLSIPSWLPWGVLALILAAFTGFYLASVIQLAATYDAISSTIVTGLLTPSGVLPPPPKPSISGLASWLDYDLDDSCASTLYPKQTHLLVTNAVTNAQVECIVRDYGPDPRVYPERIVDLDDAAFARIAPISVGILPVDVRPL